MATLRSSAHAAAHLAALATALAALASSGAVGAEAFVNFDDDSECSAEYTSGTHCVKKSDCKSHPFTKIAKGACFFGDEEMCCGFLTTGHCCEADMGAFIGMIVGIILGIILLSIGGCYWCKCCCFRKKEAPVVVQMAAPPAASVVTIAPPAYPGMSTGEPTKA